MFQSRLPRIWQIPIYLRSTNPYSSRLTMTLISSFVFRKLYTFQTHCRIADAPFQSSDAKMSVQNLREKFNQSSNGTPPPPGTSFGAVKSHSKSELFATRTTESSATKTGTSPGFVASHNGKLGTPYHPHLSNSKSPSPDRQLTMNVNGPKPYMNGSVGVESPAPSPSRSQRKSPEQSQQDIILRKWNRSSVSPDSNKSDATTGTLKAKNSVSRYISLMAFDESNHHFDKHSDNNSLSERTTEKLKSFYESNSSNTKQESFVASPVVNHVHSVDNETHRNSSSTVNNLRVKMNVDGANTRNNPHLISNGLKKSSVTERWKHEEPEVRKFHLTKGKPVLMFRNIYHLRVVGSG